MSTVLDGAKFDLLLDNAARASTSDLVVEASAPSDRDIAVVGVSARVGEAESARQLWDAVNEGVDLIREFPASRRRDAEEIARGALGGELGDPVPYAYLNDVDQFDPALYGLSNAEAELMDPHQRLFLAACMAALDDAGYGGAALRGSRTGVYASTGLVPGLYLSGYEARDAAEAGLAVSGGIASVVPSRVSHLLNLSGPALVVDTACSSAMTALIAACDDIRSGRVGAALVGAVRLTLVPPCAKALSFGIEAESHRTRTFSADAEGTGGGEACVALLLKPLRAAVRSRDNIYGVIKGYAINQDGATTGITAPSAAAQAEVIRMAWEDAGVDPRTIDYIEAHGTATKLGDPVEVDGITNAFARYTDARQACAIGSVKSNVGHLDSAAGVVGVLKVLGMLKDGVVPPTLHFMAPNPEIDFVESPVFVADTRLPWRSEGPRRSGVSSFGMSGTNTHVVVEQAPPVAEPDRPGGPECVTVSARTRSALARALHDLRAALAAEPELPLADVAHTLNTGRVVSSYRFAVVVRSTDELRAQIGLYLRGKAESRALVGEVASVRHGRHDGVAGAAANRDALRNRAQEILSQLTDSDREEALWKLAELFVTGAEVDFGLLDTAGTARRVSLPPSVGDPRRVWRPETALGAHPGGGPAPAFSKDHPLVHRHQLNGPDVDVFESDFSAPTTFELGEHVVNGSHVIVGTAFLEMVYSAARKFLGEAVRIENMHYLSPLVTYEDETRRTQLVVNHRVAGSSFDFLVRSTEVGTGRWVEHVRGVVESINAGGAEPAHVDVEQIIADYQRAEAPVVYRSDLVQTAGPYWESVQSVYCSADSRILIHFSANADTRRVKSDYALFPPIMDSSLNLALLNEDDAFLPLALGCGEIYGPQPDAGYSWMIPDDREDLADTSVRTSQVIMCDEDGNVFARFTGYTVGRLTDPSIFLPEGKEPTPFHTLVWRPSPERHQEPGRQSDTLVVGTLRDQLGNALCEEAARQGARTAVLRLDASEDDVEAWVGSVDPRSTARIIQVLPGEGCSTGERLRAIFLVLRAIHRRPWPDGLHYVLVTQNAHSVREGEHVDPAAHAADAMVVSLDGENPRISLGVLDVGASDVKDPAGAGVVLRAAAVSFPRRRCAVRGSSWFESALVVADVDDAPDVRSLPAGAVLVTGGTGGMGRALARMLVRADPERVVVLTSRRGAARAADGVLPDDAFVSLTAEERSRIHVVQADVADAAQVAAAVTIARERGGGLAGVVHAAGLPGGGYLMTKQWSAFADVLRPKVEGADALLQAVAAEHPAFVLLCSSMTAVFGAPGQSDYAAANAYLDGTALRLRAAGVPAVALDWTGWAESGMAYARNIDGRGSRTAFVDDETGAAWALAAATSAYPRLLVGVFDETVVAEERADLEQVVDVGCVAPAGSRREGGGDASRPGQATARKRLEDVTVRGIDESAIGDVARAVIEAWASALGVDEVDVHQAFFEAGGNSLLASRLQVLLDEQFPGAVSIVELFVYDTVDKLTAYIAEKVASPGSADYSGVPAADASRAGSTSRRLEHMLDEFLEGRRSIEDVLNE